MATLMDTLRLLKAGYTKAEILAMSETPETQEPAPAVETESKGADTVDTPEEQQTQTDVDTTEPEPDYKALYEQSQNELKEAQQSNINKDIDVAKTSNALEDAFRKFM